MGQLVLPTSPTLPDTPAMFRRLLAAAATLLVAAATIALVAAAAADMRRNPQAAIAQGLAALFLAESLLIAQLLTLKRR